ncbi:MAG: hypothetical protein KDK70_17610 [Myxococcales bacterium]|nr:hypothetical protein [Myxococcales bacterium]
MSVVRRARRLGLLSFVTGTLVGCFDPDPAGGESQGTGGTAPDPSASSDPSADATGPVPTSGGSQSSAASDATSVTTGASDTQDPSATGFLFDVGGVETDGETDGPPPPGGPGSCRASEAYGAAGGFPAYDDPAYASFDSTVLLMTNNAFGGGSILRVFDISGPAPPPNMNYYAPMYVHPSWTAANVGGAVFGLTLDSDGNAYLASTTVYGNTTTPGTIYRVDAITAAISVFAELPNNGPGIGNINYDCHSETIYASNHEDGRIYQIEMDGSIRSTYRHSTGSVTIGPANDPGEPNGVFSDLGDRVWAVQSHAGRLYYSVWNEDSGRQSAVLENEIWSVAYVDDEGIPDAATAELEATVPGLNGNTYSNPVSDISFAATGWMLAAERTMTGDSQTLAHQSTTYEFQQIGGIWQVQGTTYVVGELPNSSAGGVDHDFEEGGYVWMTGDALDFYTPDVVYGVQGTPYGGGDITNSTLIDHDAEIVGQDKTAQGDVELPIPGDASPPPPPPEG